MASADKFPSQEICNLSIPNREEITIQSLEDLLLEKHRLKQMEERQRYHYSVTDLEVEEVIKNHKQVESYLEEYYDYNFHFLNSRRWIICRYQLTSASDDNVTWIYKGMAHLNSEHAVADATAHPRAFCTIEFNRYFIKDDDEWIDVCTFIEGEEKTLYYALKTSKLPLHGSTPTCSRVFAYIYKQKLRPEFIFFR